MRVPALMLGVSLAALAAGCAPYRNYDHRDEMYRAEQSYRPARDADAPRRTAQRSAPRPRLSGVQRIEKPPRTASESARRQNRPTPAVAKSTSPPSKPAPAVASVPAAPPAAAPAAVQAPKEPAATVANSSPTPAAAKAPGPAIPGAAAAAQQPAASDAAARKEIADGYRLLRAGFVKKARERFEAAKAAAPGEATLAEARSLDPTYLASVAFPDVQADAEQAKRLYRRAIMLGVAEAKTDLERLEGAAAVAQPTPPSGAAQPQ